MDQGPNIEALLASPYREGVNAVEAEDWAKAIKWLEPIYNEVPGYEKVRIYYSYAVGMRAYESRLWKDSYEYLQAVKKEDRNFKDCPEILRLVERKLEAAAIFDQALESIEEQKNIQPETQQWDQIASNLEDAKKLDPEHKEIPAKLAEIQRYQTAREQYIASLEDLQERKYKEAREKLDSIDNSYREFCPELDSRREEATSGSFDMRIAILRSWCAGGVVSGDEYKHLSHLARGVADDSVPDVLPAFRPTRRGSDSGSRRGRPLPARQ